MTIQTEDSVKTLSAFFLSLGVVLVAFNGFDPLGVCDGDVDGILQKVEHGNPIFPGRFHADIPAVVLQQPSLENKYLAVEGRESPLLILRLDSF